MMLTWQTFAALAAGVGIGIIFGALPGLTTSMAMSIFVPVTFFMKPLIGIPFLLGLYKGGIYGGSITAILIATPGTNAAAATVMDGYEMAKRGKAKKALNMALYASVIGEVFGELVLLFGVGLLAKVALKFGAVETFAILLFAYTIIAGLSGDSLLKGIMAAAFGLFIGTIGIDPILGVDRFCFGSLQLTTGVSFVPMLIGTFAISEVMINMEKRISGESSADAIKVDKNDSGKITKAEWKECLPVIGGGSLIGTFIGLLPGIGQPVAAFLGYGLAKGISKHPQDFGTGAIAGVAGPEAANNAVNGSAMVPLLSLGIPGDTNSAILLGALVAQGLSPGPLLFQRSGPMIYAILIAMVLGNILFFVIGKLALPVVSKAAYIPKNIMLPFIVTMACIGGFAIKGNTFEIMILGVFGVIGYLFKKGGFPIAPFVIGSLLGSSTEAAFARSLLLGNGSIAIFFQKKIALVFIIITMIVVLGIAVKTIYTHFKKVNNQKQ